MVVAGEWQCHQILQIYMILWGYLSEMLCFTKQGARSAAAGVQHFLMLVSGQYEVSPNTVNLHDFVRVHQLPAWMPAWDWIYCCPCDWIYCRCDTPTAMKNYWMCWRASCEIAIWFRRKPRPCWVPSAFPYDEAPCAGPRRPHAILPSNIDVMPVV